MRCPPEALPGSNDFVHNGHTDLGTVATGDAGTQHAAFVANQKFKLTRFRVLQNNVTALGVGQHNDQFHGLVQDGIDIKRIGNARGHICQRAQLLQFRLFFKHIVFQLLKFLLDRFQAIQNDRGHRQPPPAAAIRAARRPYC